jgi:hypothetical protein
MFARLGELAVPITALGAALICTFAYKMGQPYFVEEGLRSNILTETYGIAFTVIILDALAKRRDRQRLRPARLSAYRESSIIYHRLRSLWVDMAIAAANRRYIESDQIFEQSVVQGVRNSFNVMGNAPTFPPQPWHAHLEISCTEISGLVDRYIGRYISISEMEIISALRAIESSAFLGAARGIRSIAAFTGGHFPITADIDECFPLNELRKSLEKARKEFRKDEVGLLAPLSFLEVDDQLTGRPFGSSRLPEGSTPPRFHVGATPPPTVA